MSTCIIDNWNLFGDANIKNDKGQILVASKYLLKDYMIYKDFNINCYVLYIDNVEYKRNIHLSNLMNLVDKVGI